MKPMFFGDSQRKLYGVYDAPSGSQRRSHAVLLCYPLVQEYGSSHWAFRRLASMLARDGHHVLRFDYFGTGDSEGRIEAGDPGIWIDNIQQAAIELKELSGARDLSLLGKRLGATLATIACQRGLDAQRLILWDPVTSGREHVQELERWDARRNLLLLHADRSRNLNKTELLGYAFPPPLRAALKALTIDFEPPRARRVAIFGSDERASYRQLREGLAARGVAVELSVGGSDQRQVVEAQDRAQLSGSILSQMADELAGALNT